MKKSNIYPSIVLGCVCVAVALLLSGINMFTAPIIADRQDADANAALLEVLPNGKDFKPLEITDAYPEVITDGWKADGGFVFKATVNGYKPGLVIMCGIDAEGKIAGVKHIVTNETYGFEAELNGAYVGDTIDSAELIIATGATSKSMTSLAYFDAVKASLQAAVIAGGGSVDVRNPEQILQDNLNAALGTTDVKFSRWIATEIVTGVDKVYAAEGGAGYVFVIGESFIGVNESGVVTQGVSEENATAAVAAYEIVSASKLTKLTELPSGIKKNVLAAYVTESGNYLFELEGYGFYDAYGSSIKITVTISAEGKIIDCATTDQHKDEGYGQSATEEYSAQFVGVDAETLKSSTDLGAISSATYTTQGYRKALQAAFDAFAKITAEGGNEQ